MVAKLLHRKAVFEQAISADGVERFDMPVHPISVILLCLRPLNNTGTLANFADYLSVCAAVNRVTLQWRGASLFSMSGGDLAALNYHRHGMLPQEANGDDTDDERRCVVLPMVLGRFAYDSRSCVPNSHRGELTLEVDFDIADTGYDGLRFGVETIELPGARPKELERKVTTTQTFAATGDNDVQLPVGNLLRGLLAFGTTGFAGASPAPTLGEMSLYVNNEQTVYSATDFEVAHMLSGLMGRQRPSLRHGHRVDATAASTSEKTANPVLFEPDSFGSYCWLDVDPTRDDEFALDLKTAQNCFLRVNAEAANAARVVSVERVPVNSLA